MAGTRVEMTPYVLTITISYRNRRMFGALLGTLKRFKNDEAKQKDKVRPA